jgi:hypothetical protein
MRSPSRFEENILQVLSNLLTLESAEAGDYQAALDKRSCDADRAELARLRDDHRRHAAQLKLMIHTWGGPLKRTGSTHGPHGAHDERSTICAKGYRALAGIIGGRAVLELLKREEESVTRAYLTALSEPLPHRVRSGLECALREQLLHGAWFEAVLEHERWHPLRLRAARRHASPN